MTTTYIPRQTRYIVTGPNGDVLFTETRKHDRFTAPQEHDAAASLLHRLAAASDGEPGVYRCTLTPVAHGTGPGTTGSPCAGALTLRRWPGATRRGLARLGVVEIEEAFNDTRT